MALTVVMVIVLVTSAARLYRLLRPGDSAGITGAAKSVFQQPLVRSHVRRQQLRLLRRALREGSAEVHGKVLELLLRNL